MQKNKLRPAITGRSIEISAVPPVIFAQRANTLPAVTVPTVAAYCFFSGAARKGTSEKALRAPAFSRGGGSLKENGFPTFLRQRIFVNNIIAYKKSQVF